MSKALLPSFNDMLNYVDGVIQRHGDELDVEAMWQIRQELDRLRADLTAAREEIARFQWQPIETAPKPGVNVILGVFLSPDDPGWWVEDPDCYWDGQTWRNWPDHRPSPTHWFCNRYVPEKPAINAAAGIEEPRT